jgi:hypothetical protein
MVMPDSLADVKRGDTVYYTGMYGSSRQCEVTAAGVKWLTVNGERFSRHSGYHVSGSSAVRIETVAGHEDRIEREALTARLRPWGWHPAQGKFPMTTGQLRRAVALIEQFEAEGQP